ncbi:MAG: hypothetical protein KC592_06485 [Nitrospira sp.]|nr:hypothetical protein [Nitrospira sp.]HBP87894.1 hypothetical protein [Nitrospiraceae bacterium]
MGRKKNPDNEIFPEMAAMLEGMQELMCDENGKPLSPDHPQYQKMAGLIENIANRARKRDQQDPSTSGQQGTA